MRAPLRPAAALLLLLAAAGPPSKGQLQDAQRAHAADLAAQSAAQAQARAAETEALRLADERVAAAARLRAAEEALARAQQRLDDLGRRRDAVRARMQADSRALAPLLPLIERLSLFPAETLLAVPASPEDAVRGVLVLGGLTRQIRARAEAVAAERTELAGLQAQLDAALPGLHAAEQEQRQQSAALDASLAQARRDRTGAETRAEAAAARAAADAARARSRPAAIAALDTARAAAARQRAAASNAAASAAPPPPATAALPAGRGGWVSPVAGRVVRPFGAPGDAGPANGITMQTPPGARVVSPCAGGVAFAAPFRSYGLLVILDCGGDSHVVLAGLGRLDVSAGQQVRRGEPVGVMAQGSPSLYMELRRGSQPTDPTPYLRPTL